MNRDRNNIFITEEESCVCKLDGMKFNSSREMIWHVRKLYKLDFENYIIKAYYDDIRPVCLKTGSNLSFKASKLGPFFKNFSKNNFPRKRHTDESKIKIKAGCEKSALEKFGVKNVFESNWCKDKIKKTNLKKYGVENPSKSKEIQLKSLTSFYKTISNRPVKVYPISSYDPNKPSSYELDFSKKLTLAKIDHVTPYLYMGKRYDFYIPEINTVVEIDGEAYHPEELSSLTLLTLNNAINDNKKNSVISQSAHSFVRIRYNTDVFLFSGVDSLKIELEKNKYNSPTKISYRQKIIKKEYFKRYINYRGKGKILGYKYLFLKFLRTFQPLLPELPLEENLSDVMKAVSKSDFSKIYDSASREFSNKGSTVGHNYLKHHFKSYWKSRFKKNPSPYDAWLDDKIMSDVIAYRIGVNDSDEIFDFSLQQMITGMSARRLTVSFFKPVLAAAIYKHYLGNHPNPIVLDPCCGFGGRLIGFKSIYPTGTYIGCEPNVETYAELIGMIDREGLTNVKIHNCKFEDYTGPFDVDLTFTSIPYHDLEIYSNHVDYKDFDLWRNKFIGSIEKRCKNCYINLNEECADKIGWRNIDNYILSNPTHFSKITSVRREVIVKV